MNTYAHVHMCLNVNVYMHMRVPLLVLSNITAHENNNMPKRKPACHKHGLSNIPGRTHMCIACACTNIIYIYIYTTLFECVYTHIC